MSKNYKVVEEISKSGHKIVKINDYYLHSKYDPIKEAKRFAEKHFKKNFLHILFGIGAGYFAKELSEKLTEDEFLIIVDPFEKIINFQFENIENYNRTILIIGEKKELFSQMLERFVGIFGKRICFITSPNYNHIAIDYYHDLLKIVKDCIYMEVVNINTINYFSRDWERNFTLNLFYAFNDIPFKELKNFYEEPVVVASGGPSLTKQIPLLKSIRNHIVLISSGSTINTLLSHHIEPDFVVTIDGGINNYKHFEDLNLKNTQMIYSLSNHHKIREHFNSRSVVFNTNKEVEKYVQKLINKDVDTILGGASVATYALSIAEKITTGAIALIGQDLAYTDNKSHAENNKNFKVIDEEAIKKRGMFYTKGYFEDQVLTDYPFLLMKNNFEHLLKTFKNPERIYNCTEGGIKIEGYQQISFQQFCEKFVDRNKIPVSFNKKFCLEKTRDDWEKFLKLVREEINKHENVERLVKDAISLLKRNKSRSNFSTKILKELDKVDEKLKKYFKDGFMSIIAQPIIIKIYHNNLPKENESEKETYQRVYKRSLNLYSELLHAAAESKSNFQFLKEKIEKKIKVFNNEG
ncbi:motility associated factor glycosyltransferase family protein [Aeribacillus sp. FSL M8-0235]|uniref:motility associated factor glycosyltransferase family protein n=1 Tax=Aeribacillus sp. FSL M8-0235 TaxID=2954576 RepID=UPI0030FB3EBA